jgi:hypothetical protein
MDINLKQWLVLAWFKGIFALKDTKYHHIPDLYQHDLDKHIDHSMIQTYDLTEISQNTILVSFQFLLGIQVKLASWLSSLL